MKRLDDSTAFVTGGADGIGLAIARRFAGEGARVMIADVRESQAQASAHAARDDGLELHAHGVDVTDEAALEGAFAACRERLGVPTAVVVNAGVMDLAPAVELDAARFRRVVEVNLVGAYLSARAAMLAMLAGGVSGSITLMGSVAGLRGIPGNAAYSASKFGVAGLTQVLAAELATSGIRVNAVSPGQIATPMLLEVIRGKAAASGRPEAEVERELLDRVPMRRGGSAEEVAEVFVWLASAGAAYVTGQNIAVDGGWTVG